MKRCFVVGVLIVLVGAFGMAGGQGEPGTAQVRQIRLSHTHQGNESSEIHTAAVIFRDYVNQNSETLSVSIHPAGELGEEREVYEAMQLGSGAQAVISGTAILSNFNERIAVLDLPFVWADYAHVHRVLDGAVGDTIAGELEAEGFKVVAWMDSWGFRNVITANRPVRSPEDLRGLRIRTIPTPVYVAAVNAMGANATPMAFGEVYTAMQTGVLDGYEHGASVTIANRFYEVANYMTLTQHLFGPLAFVFSNAEWQQYSEAEQAVILEGARRARDEQRRLAPIREAEAFEELRSRGMEIIEIDTSTFEQNAVEVQDEIAAERGATDLLRQIRAQR